MKNDNMTKEKLIKEIDLLKIKIMELEKSLIERKQTDGTQLQEKNFSENLLETANTFILTLDENANITNFNQCAEKITGYTKEEVLGKNWFEIFIPLEAKKTIPEVLKMYWIQCR